MRVIIDELKESLSKETKQRHQLQSVVENQLIIHCEKATRCRGRTTKWPVQIVILIIELLVHGTNTSSILEILKMMLSKLQGIELKKAPSVNYCHQCRIILFIINNILVGIRLGRSKKWRQLFTNGTLCHQCKLQDLILDPGDEHGTFIVSSCIILTIKMAEAKVECVEKTVH